MSFAGSSETQLQRQLDRRYGTRDAQFARSLGTLLGPPILEGNRVEGLVNGDAIFPAMLDAIRNATQTITFETYIYWSEGTGREFSEALSERARAGVKVHVLLDWVGSSKMDPAYLDDMTRAGVEIERFHKPRWNRLPSLNNRTHRKVLVVDGRIGFTGGVGIADQWRGDARDPSEWRDTHFRIEGPVVAQMQAVFMDNWIKARGRVLHDERYFPPLEPRGTQRAQVFGSSPSGGSENMQLMYLLAITAAGESIDLASSYFVPDALTIRTLVAAAQRGVRVRIITPGEHIDSAVVRRASRATWGDLLRAGIGIAEYEPTMYHCKIMIVDSLFVSVGSTNFDTRSFRINDEANLNILDAVFARSQVDVFEADWQRSHPVTYGEWRKRSWRERGLERLAVLLKTQL